MFLIRADGNAKIGAGHLMRCLTIADELHRYVDSGEILFLCADEQSAQLAQDRGYEAFVLGSDPYGSIPHGSTSDEGNSYGSTSYGSTSDGKNPFGSSSYDMEAELPAWSGVPGIHEGTNSILVDSYFVTEHYLREIKKYGVVSLLDDMGTERFPVDRIINYNAFADREQYESLYKGSETGLVLGSAYVPVRPQFRGSTYRVRVKAENILITTGGGDIDNIAGQILKKVREAAAAAGAENGDGIDEKLNYHLIIGRFNPHFEEMQALERSSDNIHIYHDVQNMAELMSRCDLAVTAGGSTVYELAAIGVPFICFSYAENQERIADFFHTEEIAFCAGKYHKDPEPVLERIAEQTMALVQDHEKRCRCFCRERRLTDGMGARRLAEILRASSR